MNISFLITAFIIIMLIFVLISLGVSLFYLVRDQGKTKNTVKALTIRIVLSFALFLILFILFALGWIEPHAILGKP